MNHATDTEVPTFRPHHSPGRPGTTVEDRSPSESPVFTGDSPQITLFDLAAGFDGSVAVRKQGAGGFGSNDPLVVAGAIKLCGVRRRRLPVREVVWMPDRSRDVDCPAQPRGRYRSPITQPGYGKGRAPGNKGKTYHPDPLTTSETFQLLDAIGVHDVKSWKLQLRNHALLVLLWRSGLRIFEALKLEEHDLNREHGAVLVRRGKGNKTSLCGMDPWGFEQVGYWLEVRRALELPDGPIFCCLEGPTKGGPMRAAYVRAWLRWTVNQTQIAKRVHPHGFRHALACELVREGVPVAFISRQLRHSNVGTTATYLQGIAPQETLDVMMARPAPGEAL